MAKRLRSNKGKLVPFETRTLKETVSGMSKVLSAVETPKTRTKTVEVGPKRGWSKVKDNTTSGKSRKRKVASSSESKYDVEEDVQNITPSASKKSVGKKVMQTVENVPIDKVSFHLPENAQRWKFIYHRKLALERDLGKEALEMEAVMELIREAGLMKTVCNLGDCYENLVKEFLVHLK